MFGFLGSLHPAFIMMMAVAAFSAVPLLFNLGNAGESPFLFTGIQQICTGLGMGIGVRILIPSDKRKFMRSRIVVYDIINHCKTKLMLFSVIGHCGYVLFALGIIFVDISIAAILYETWPLFLVLLLSFLFKDRPRYNPVLGTLIFVVMALFGVALVTLSQSDSPHPLLASGTDFVNFGTAIGVFLVLMSAFCGGADGAGTLKLGIMLADKHTNRNDRGTGELVFTMVVTCIGKVFAGGVLCVIGLASSEALSMQQMFYAVFAGLFVTLIGATAYRVANLKTDDLGVNALAYVTPLIALIWLWMFSILRVSHLDYLIIGAMGIVAANLLINVKASERVAYKALVVSLWAFGTFVYFHDGYATDVSLELPVTVFILILAFRVDRLVRRTGQEEEWMIEVFRRLRSMESEMQDDDKASKALNASWKALLVVDHHKSVEKLKWAYGRMVAQLGNVRAVGVDAGEVTEIQRMVDKLAHSRQQGSRFGEVIAIFLAGALIVFGLLVFNGDREIYGEITSFVLSSIVVFLLFNILDLQEDRRDETLVKGERGEYIINFGEVKNREKQQYISMALSGVIVVVFAVLFAAA